MILNRRQMYERNKEHILEDYWPEDLIATVDSYRFVNQERGLPPGAHGSDPGRYVASRMVEDGSFLVSYEDVRAYLRDELGLDYDDPLRAWEVYVSMIGDDLRKLYVELCGKKRRR